MKVIIDSTEQSLQVYADDKLVKSYRVSTAKKGVGEVKGSEQTPRGKHIIRAKIGDAAPANTVFIGRRPTGEVYSPSLRVAYPNRDWILTRIMWLSGLEKGRNRLGNVDTMRRYIYIHGTPDDVQVGAPSSHGCIRMRNADIVELYNLLPHGTVVEII